MSQRAVVIGGGAIGISPLAVVPKTPINVALSRRCRSRRFLQVFLMKPRTSSIDSILLNRAHEGCSRGIQNRPQGGLRGPEYGFRVGI